MNKRQDSFEAGRIPAWLAILIIIVLALVAWLVIVSLSEQVPDGAGDSSLTLVLPEPIYSFVGEVTGDEFTATRIVAQE